MEVQPPPRLTLMLPTPKRAPHSLDGIMNLISNVEDQVWFKGIVREFTPDEADEILAETDSVSRVTCFAEKFERHYFPLSYIFSDGYLDDWEMEDNNSVYTILRNGIPYTLFGIQPEEVHDAWRSCYGEGRALMMLIPMLQDGYFRKDDDIRVSWMESAAEYISKDTLLKIPHHGIPQNSLIQAVEGTPLEGVAHVASWLMSNSGNLFVDDNYTDGEFQSTDSWDNDVITEASEIWKKAQRILVPMNKLGSWLEEEGADMNERFSQMLDFILERVDQLPINFEETVQQKEREITRMHRGIL